MTRKEFTRLEPNTHYAWVWSGKIINVQKGHAFLHGLLNQLLWEDEWNKVSLRTFIENSTIRKATNSEIVLYKKLGESK